MSLRSKPLKSFASDIYHRAPVAGGSAYTGLAATIGIDQRFTMLANREPGERYESGAEGFEGETKIASGLERSDKINACWPTADHFPRSQSSHRAYG
jgi:hypothetical protein